MIPLFCWLLGCCGQHFTRYMFCIYKLRKESLWEGFACQWKILFLDKELHSLMSRHLLWSDFLCTIKHFCLKLISFDLCSTDKEMHKRQEMLSNLKSKAKQMATSFNMSNFANRSVVLAMIYKNSSFLNHNLFFKHISLLYSSFQVNIIMIFC